MSAPVTAPRDIEGGGRMVIVWCPGCDSQHAFWTADDDGRTYRDQACWTWDGNREAPTFSPSLLVHSHQAFIDSSLTGDDPLDPSNITTTPQCHSFLRDGRWEFLGDSTHHLAGQSVDMVPLPDWLLVA